MGLAYTVDSPIKVAQYGIASVISIVENRLIEMMRKHYYPSVDRPYFPINTHEEDFHAVMSVTFHPAEDDNLQPLKEKSGDLLKTATAWQKGPVPQGYNAAVTKPILKRLVKQCNIINKAVTAGKSDVELKKLITEGHDIFHEIKEKCNNMGH